MANELQWYSAMDLALLDTSTHELRCKSVLLAIKRLLTQESMGATFGPLGAPPAAAAAVVEGSSNGVAAGMDGVDRWTGLADLVLGPSNGAAHSWIVLKLGEYRLLIDYAYPGSATNYHSCTFGISKEPFTGGSTTARPTAADESVGATSHAFTLTQTQVWGTGGRAHLSVAQDPSGQWLAWIGHSRNGSAEFSGLYGLQTKKGSHASDTFKGLIYVEGTSSTAANNSVAKYSGPAFANASSTTAVMRGRSLLNSAAVVYSFFMRAYSGGNGWQAGWSSDQQTGEYHEIAAELYCATSGYFGRAGGGELYDVTEIHQAPHGSTYPATGDVERISIGSLLFPFTAAPLL